MIFPWQRVERFGRLRQAYSIRAGPGRVPGQSVAAASGPQTLREAEAGAGAHARLRGRTDAGVAGGMDGSLPGAELEAPAVALQPGGATASLLRGEENAPGAGELVEVNHRPDDGQTSLVTVLYRCQAMHSFNLPERKKMRAMYSTSCSVFVVVSLLFLLFLLVDGRHRLWSTNMAPQKGG